MLARASSSLLCLVQISQSKPKLSLEPYASQILYMGAYYILVTFSWTQPSTQTLGFLEKWKSSDLSACRTQPNLICLYSQKKKSYMFVLCSSFNTLLPFMRRLNQLDVAQVIFNLQTLSISAKSKKKKEKSSQLLLVQKV